MREAVPPLSEEQLAALLARLAPADACCGSEPGLFSLLREDAAIYRGRGTAEAEQLRAFVMLSLARAGNADALMLYVLEELETGTNPYAVAAAARAARHASAMPAKTADLLVAAIERMRHRDDFVHLDAYPPLPAVARTTAVQEIVMALAAADLDGCAALAGLWARARGGNYLSPAATDALRSVIARAPAPASCCAQDVEVDVSDPHPTAPSIDAVRAVELQNQDGTRAIFGQLLAGRTSLIAFFYTRCMNPYKCSRTVSQLAKLRELIRGGPGDAEIMIAGITYDPDYDLPERLYRYGADRGMVFDERCQLLRTTGSFAPIRDGLELAVGYGSATVNRHRIELLFVDPAGNVVAANLRRLWDERDALAALTAIQAGETGKARAVAGGCCG